jgi:hypothetical protein
MGCLGKRWDVGRSTHPHVRERCRQEEGTLKKVYAKGPMRGRKPRQQQNREVIATDPRWPIRAGSKYGRQWSPGMIRCQERSRYDTLSFTKQLIKTSVLKCVRGCYGGCYHKQHCKDNCNNVFDETQRPAFLGISQMIPSVKEVRLCCLKFK